MTPTPHALISVSDKTSIADFARALVDRGFTLVSTGGTARALAAAGVPLSAVSDVTGFPEMMDGRVKTLHPRIHGGILARRDRPDDLRAAGEHGIPLIDLVVANLYPFARAAADPALPVGALLEQIDIGGPSLIRSAAKNFRDVLVVVDPADYQRVIDLMDAPGGLSLDARLSLARKAFAHTAAYDTMIAATFDAFEVGDGGVARGPAQAGGRLPASLVLGLQKVRDLRYGENPHQPAAWYRPVGDGGEQIAVLQGKELSYTNLLDLDAAVRIAAEFEEPAAVVIKHTNPCGAAVRATLAEAYTEARDADPLSAFGGIVGLNRPIDEATARAVVSTFIEAVVAPGVDDESRPILATKKNMRLVVVPPAGLVMPGLSGRDLRSIFGGVLVQQQDAVGELAGLASLEAAERAGFRVVTRRRPSADEWQALRFAWRICAHVKSNAVIFTGATSTRAVGAGQMSRVDAVHVAALKAAGRAEAGGTGRPLEGSVAASDAYFPFRDGLDAIAAAGATAVIQPGGSVRDAVVIAAADEHGMAMVFTGRRHFRH